jgi:hypothetical protein
MKNIKKKPPLPESDIDPDTIERDDAIIGVALRWSLAVFAAAAVIVVAAVYFLWPKPTVAENKQTKLAPVALRAMSDAQLPRVTFTDITRRQQAPPRNQGRRLRVLRFRRRRRPGPAVREQPPPLAVGP